MSQGPETNFLEVSILSSRYLLWQKYTSISYSSTLVQGCLSEALGFMAAAPSLAHSADDWNAVMTGEYK